MTDAEIQLFHWLYDMLPRIVKTTPTSTFIPSILGKKKLVIISRYPLKSVYFLPKSKKSSETVHYYF